MESELEQGGESVGNPSIKPETFVQTLRRGTVEFARHTLTRAKRNIPLILGVLTAGTLAGEATAFSLVKSGQSETTTLIIVGAVTVGTTIGAYHYLRTRFGNF